VKKYFLLLLFFSCRVSFATVWQVGPSHTYTMPSQVSTLVQNGDTVDIDAGNYPSDVCRWQAHNLLLRGVGGFAHLESNGLSWGDKAIWVIQGNNCAVEWIEFSECTSTSQNGAGIRQEGLNLTVSHCYFHNNENGILAGAFSPSKFIIEFSEFAYNGYGDGYSHNLYIGNIDTLVFRYNYSHHCHVGHELKSRAKVNYILYNRISNEATGDASREIDLPNGGLTIIIGNEIEQGPNSQNSNIIGFGLEGLSNPSPHQLYVINNTIVNDRSTGSFLSVLSGTALLKAYNNIFAGPGAIISGSVAVVDTSNNFYSTVPAAGFVNAAGYDYHLLSSSGAINGGTNPGSAGIFSLSPVYEYVHAANMTNRITNAQLDRGAHEYGTTTGVENSAMGNVEINVFSNPSDGNIVVVSEKKIEEVIVSDVSGRIIIKQSTLEDKTISISLHNFADGIYFVSVQSENKTQASRKICLQK
jgi:hypothetical protein